MNSCIILKTNVVSLFYGKYCDIDVIKFDENDLNIQNKIETLLSCANESLYSWKQWHRDGSVIIQDERLLTIIPSVTLYFIPQISISINTLDYNQKKSNHTMEYVNNLTANSSTFLTITNFEDSTLAWIKSIFNH